MSAPFFTIIMPVYNAGGYLRQAIHSVLSQSFKDWELIIVDDVSTDNSHSIAQEAADSDSRISLICMGENSGSAFRPRLTALQRAEGDYIVELDADDALASDYLSILAHALKSHRNLSCAFGRLLTPDGQPVLDNEIPAGTVLTGMEALAATIDSWRHSAMGAVDRHLYTTAFERFGMPPKGMCSDEVLTRMLLACANSVIITDAKYFYTPNEESITKKQTLKLFDRIESAFALLRISNLVNSPEVWEAASHEFFHTFLSMSRLYVGFPFSSSEDRNDTRQRLRNMYNRLSTQRFRRVIPLRNRIFLRFGFKCYLSALRHYDRSR